MATGVVSWSQTGTSNATADSTVNWQEGQAPSSINDSARNMMASVAKWRDDIAGAIVTAGSSTAYTVSSYQGFTSLGEMSGQVIAFTPHTTNTGSACTLNVDSLGAKPLRSAPSADLQAGTIIQGTPYLATYNNTDGAWYLQGFYGNPYSIPLGGSIEYWLPTAPNSAFVFPFGQAISRSTYATLFSAMGTIYGAGDGSTTFNLPDLRGRVTACPDNMGGSDAGRLSGSGITSTRTTLGGAGGEGLHALTTAELPVHSHANTIIDNGHSHNTPITNLNVAYQGLSGIGLTGSSALQMTTVTFGVATATTGISIANANAGSGSAHNIVQPTILCNRIMRII